MAKSIIGISGHPTYDVATYYYLKEKAIHHSDGLLEVVAEVFVKTCGFERSHRVNLSQHRAIDRSSPCAYNIRAWETSTLF